MNYSFEEISRQAKAFFDILPQDWQDSIVPFWPEYQTNSQIWVIKQHEIIIGGGIVFSTVSPDTKMYEQLAQNWFDKGYLYLGFLWIDENYRNQKLGTLWLNELFRQNTNQKYWLTVEEEELISFYTKNQFQLIQKIELPQIKEWLLAKEVC